MNIGLKNSHRNHSQVGLKQDMSNSFVGVKKDTNIKEKMGNVRHVDNSQGIINDYGKRNEPLGFYSKSSQSKPVVQSNIERKKKVDKNGYNVDKNYVA